VFDVGFALVIFPFVGFEADGNVLVFAIVSGLAEAHIDCFVEVISCGITVGCN